MRERGRRFKTCLVSRISLRPSAPQPTCGRGCWTFPPWQEAPSDPALLSSLRKELRTAAQSHPSLWEEAAGVRVGGPFGSGCIRSAGSLPRSDLGDQPPPLLSAVTSLSVGKGPRGALSHFVAEPSPVPGPQSLCVAQEGTGWENSGDICPFGVRVEARHPHSQ